MNIAFAGLRHGHIYALYHMVKTHSDYTFAGTFEENPAARADSVAHGMEKQYASYADLLADSSVDVVALGGCYGDRGRMAIEALRAGKHVMADKPLCTTLSELDEIERLAESTGKKVTAMFTMRYEPRIIALRELVRCGGLGEINNVYIGGQHPLLAESRPSWYYETGKHGGTINDIAIHGIDVLAYALGLKKFRVESARCWNRFAAAHPHFADSAQFMLTAENGAGILSDVSYSVPDGIAYGLPLYWEFRIWGTGGMAEFSLARELTFYKKGVTQPIVVPDEAPQTDFLTDFCRLVRGEPAILSMEEVFASTRSTLEIQVAADQRECDSSCVTR